MVRIHRQQPGQLFGPPWVRCPEPGQEIGLPGFVELHGPVEKSVQCALFVFPEGSGSPCSSARGRLEDGSQETRALAHSRRTVRSDSPRAVAVSGSLRPAKKRHSKTRQQRGEEASKRPIAASSVSIHSAWSTTGAS